VDVFAEKLNLTGWYAWQADPGATQPSTTGTPETQQTQAPLKVDDPKTVTYCKEALNRFADKSHQDIIKVVAEISTLGMSGIDHQNEEKTYRLKAYPDEMFSGLHLLCMMYAGFQLYDSSIDCGLDFADAYQLARDMHNRSVH